VRDARITAPRTESLFLALICIAWETVCLTVMYYLDLSIPIGTFSKILIYCSGEGLPARVIKFIQAEVIILLRSLRISSE